MVQHHNKVFYDQEIILLKDINFDNKFDLYFHQLQIQKYHLYDKFHWQVDEMFDIFPKRKSRNFNYELQCLKLVE